MTPYYDTIAAIYAAQYETLAAIDTEGLYTCLDVGCCGNDTQMFTNLFAINAILQQYNLTGALPTWDNICCNPVCGDFTGGTPSGGFGPTPTFTSLTAGDITVTDDLTVGDDTLMTGDLVLNGTFTRNSVVQPPYRGASGTLSGGTLVIAAAWVTANTIINATYTTASAAGQANISVGTITPGVSFVINGEGTNTFNWSAIVYP